MPYARAVAQVFDTMLALQLIQRNPGLVPG